MIRILSGVLLFLFAGLALAENCSFPAHDLSALPQTSGGPVEVDIQLYLSDLIEIHDSRQSFVTPMPATRLGPIRYHRRAPWPLAFAPVVSGAWG